MKIRSIVTIGLVAVPGLLSAQRIPRGGRSPLPTQPSPQIPAVAREMNLLHSRWSSEAYYAFQSQALPTIPGDVSRYVTFGAGTRSDYRLGDHFSLTFDVTQSIFGDPQQTTSAEGGVRFRPIVQSARFKPFFDARGGYLQTTNNFSSNGAPTIAGNGLLDDRMHQGSRGGGLFGGAGAEFGISNSWSLVTEASAMRSRMTIYRAASTTGIPQGTGYWTSIYRLQLGMRYNHTRSALQMSNLKQNPLK